MFERASQRKMKSNSRRDENSKYDIVGESRSVRDIAEGGGSGTNAQLERIKSSKRI